MNDETNNAQRLAKNFVLTFVALVIVAFLALVANLRHDVPKQNTPSHTASKEQRTQATRIEQEVRTETIPYGRHTVNDDNITYRQKRLRTAGIAGVKAYTYEVTYTDGQETTRRLIREEVTRQPTNEVTVVGTKTTWSCIDVTSHDYNWSNDMLCITSDGRTQYTSYSGARSLKRL